MKKVLRFLLILIVILLVGYLILCAVSPSVMEIERSTTINAPKDVVWNQMVNLENNTNWSPWEEQDSTITSTITGPAGQPGQKSAWVSKRSGSGNMTIASIEGDSMSYNLHFDGFFGGEAMGWVKVAEENGSTKATNGFSSKTDFWMRGMSALFGKAYMEAQITRGLDLLKEYCESGKAGTAAPKFDIQEATFPATTFATIRKVIKFSEMDSFYSQSYQALGAAAGATITGNAFSITYKWDEANGEADVAAAFPVSGPAKGMTMFTIPESKAFLLKYTGPYSGLMPAHMAISQHAMSNGMPQPMAVEEYIAMPPQVTDSNKFVTHIYYIQQ